MIALSSDLEKYLPKIRSTAVYNVARRTATEFAPVLSQRLGNRVWLKREDQQPVFSFKLRGAYNFLAKADPASLAKGVVAASAGNHAQGVALGARILGIKATIVVPVTTPSVKVEAIRRLGAEVILHGDTYDEAFARAKEFDLVFVHPYDDPDVIAGQGTVGLELIEDMPVTPDAVFVPVGGGGLLAGVALAVKALSPSTKVYGVEPVDAAAMYHSLESGVRVKLDSVGLFADGVAVRQVGEENFRICRDLVDGVILVENDDICAAVKEVFEDRRAVLEPSGALAYAGLKEWVKTTQTSELNLVAIASGANLNFDRLRHISERAQIGDRREAIFAVHIPERPGAFVQLCQAIGNRLVTEFNYRYGNPDQATVFVGIEIIDQKDRDQITFNLKTSGFESIDLTEDELAKTHIRHMVGGRTSQEMEERFVHVDFPERPGALLKFLTGLGSGWNISLFHYRNHGTDRGRVLAGIQIPLEDKGLFDQRLSDLGYTYTEVTDQPSLKFFL